MKQKGPIKTFRMISKSGNPLVSMIVQSANCLVFIYSPGGVITTIFVTSAMHYGYNLILPIIHSGSLL